MRVKQVLPIISSLMLVFVGCEKYDPQPDHPLPKDRPNYTNTVYFNLDGGYIRSQRESGVPGTLVVGEGAIEVKEEGDSLIVYCEPSCRHYPLCESMLDKTKCPTVVHIFRMAIPVEKIKEGMELSEKEVSLKVSEYSFMYDQPYTEYYVNHKIETLNVTITYVEERRERSVIAKFYGFGHIEDNGVFGENGRATELTEGRLWITRPNNVITRDYRYWRHMRKQRMGLVPSLGFKLPDTEFFADDGYSRRGAMCVDYNQNKDSVIVYAEPRADDNARRIVPQRERDAILEKLQEEFSDSDETKEKYTPRCILSYRMAIPVSKISNGASLTEEDMSIKLFWYAFYSDGTKWEEYSIPYTVESASLTMDSAGLLEGDNWDCKFSCSGHVGDNLLGLSGNGFELNDGYIKCFFPCPLEPEYAAMSGYTYEELLAERNKVLP